MKRRIVSKKRQRGIAAARSDGFAELLTLVYDYPPHHFVPEHVHEEAQLVFATKGVMTVRIASRSWIVPSQKAVWIPGRVGHSIQMSKAVSMRTLYFAPKAAKKLPVECLVLDVSPLLRELILHCCALKKLRRQDPAQDAVIRIVQTQIGAAQAAPLSLPHPTDPRAVKLANAVLKNPGDDRPLADLCAKAGGSKRTIERLFEAETGLGLGKWRQRVRLLHGVALIAEGMKVTQAALEAGYSSPSAFIAMFRRTLGVSPSGYLGLARPS